ncbi:DUF58 domain-containing protein [Deltaproteobacteria bacterium TL4]
MIDNQDFLTQLKQVELYLTPSPHANRIGIHPLSYRGRSLEFSEYREYRAGDDIKEIDWRVYARTDRYYVKQRDRHSPASSLIVFDNSASMNFASESSTLSKFRAASLLAFGIGYVLHKQGDGLSLHPMYTSEKILMPRASRKAFYHLVQQLKKLKDGQEPTSGNFQLNHPIRSIDHLFLISDFLVPESEWQRWIKMSQFTARNISFYRILDSEEIKPTFRQFQIQNLENPTQKRWISQQDWEKYQTNFSCHHENLRQSCLQQHIELQQLTTETSIYPAIRKTLSLHQHTLRS